MQAQVKIATAKITDNAPEELGRLLEEGLRPFTGADAGIFCIRNASSGAPAFRVIHAWGFSPEFRRIVGKNALDAIAERASAGRPLIIKPESPRDEDVLGPALRAEGFRTCVYIPLMSGAECLGGFGIAAHTRPSYSPELIRALESIGRLIAGRMAQARAEQSLREREAGFRALADNIRAAVFICLPDGRIAYANEAAAHQTGRPREQLTTLHCRSVFSPDALREIESRVAAGLDSWRFEVEGYLQPCVGKPLPVEYVACAIPWRGDVGIQVIARDLSWQRSMEEETARVALWEREQLGRELHDGIAQDIVAASLLFEAAQQAEGPEREPRAERVRATLQQSLQRIRQLMRGLESLDAQEQRLADALRHLAERIAGMFKVDCRFSEETHPALDDPGVNNHLFYIAREAAMNAVRHARPRRILLRLTRGAAGGGAAGNRKRRGRIRPSDGGRRRAGLADHAIPR